MDPFVLLDQSAAQGRLKPAIAKKVKAKGKYLSGAVHRVERATGIRYPPYYVEPSLPVATTSVEFGSVGALYARVIPANFQGRLSIIVQFTAPLLLFGVKGTIEAVVAHEFTHYIDLVRRFSRMQLSSDERASTLFEAGYADEERVAEPSLVFVVDKKLAALVKKKFAAGLVDDKLNDKVAKGWIEKGLPTKRVAPEENVVSVNVGVIAKANFDPMVIAEIAELEGEEGRMIDRLTPEEKEDLIDLARQLVKGEVTSVTAYGSKVAGYARADSDYDLIISAPKFQGRVRYRYVDAPVKASALIARDDLFQGDAKKASLGEFISGRLLNVHQALLNEKFVREAEVESKKRVIAESLYEISSQYGEFAQDLTIPLDYFLFDKLHKRALIYPPALYSYIKTYTCDKAAENRASTLEGFDIAARLLAEQGFFEVGDGSVKIVSEKLRGKSFARLLALFNLTTRGVRQYAVHGYAGRVGFSVVKDEALSKAKRMQQKLEPPPEMVHPKSILRLEEGFVVGKTSELVQRLAEDNGFQRYDHETKSLGEVYSTARIVTITGDSQARYVFKYFADIRSVKWAFLNIWAPGMKFSMSPQARMHREYYAGMKLRAAGVKTPRVIGAAVDDKVLAKEFIEGKPLSLFVEKLVRDSVSESAEVRMFGCGLGMVHRTGLALGDAKAENIIVTNAGLYFTDLEQAVENGDPAWDIAEFLYYAGKLSLREDGIRAVANAFLDGYRESNGGYDVVKAKASKYLAPFRPFVTPQNLKAIKESLEQHAT